MSDTPSWACICEQEQSVALDAASACHRLTAPPASPIDNFYSYMSNLIPLGTEANLRASETLGKTLLLGLVSGTEHYFRAVLAGLVHVCPIAHKNASSQQLSFGALEYYSREDLGLALLENISLATASEVKSQTKRLVGIDTKQDPSLEAAFSEYEKVCQLRHAAVHARGDLGHQNLHELGLPKTTGRLAVRIELATFHAAAAVSQNVVRAYNRLLYRKTLERWIGQKIFRGDWDHDRIVFPPVFSLFYSGVDRKGRRNAYQSYRSLLPTLRKALAPAAPPPP